MASPGDRVFMCRNRGESYFLKGAAAASPKSPASSELRDRCARVHAPYGINNCSSSSEAFSSLA